jgi:transcriptional regulator with XRE-family HTH domain
MIISKLGEKIRRLRQDSGLSLKEFASLSGVAPSTIQKIENGKMVPSILILMKITRGLNRSLNYFIEEAQELPEVRLVRIGQRKRSINPEIGTVVESIASPLKDGMLEAYMLRIRPGGEVRGETLSHSGEELVLCMRGTLRFFIGEEVHDLEEGDSLHFKAHIPHRWRNTADEEAWVLIVNTPPWFS